LAVSSNAFLFPNPQARWRWIWTMGWRMTLQSLTDEAHEDSRREAMQHLAATVGHDGLCMTHSTTDVLAVAP
jgi:hypothetical protein